MQKIKISKNLKVLILFSFELQKPSIYLFLIFNFRTNGNKGKSEFGYWHKVKPLLANTQYLFGTCKELFLTTLRRRIICQRKV